MTRMNWLVSLMVLVVAGAGAAGAVQITPAQQEAITSLTAKGALVMPLAADADSIVVNFSLAGKSATDGDLAGLKGLPKISQLNLAGTAVTDGGLAQIAGLTELTHLHLEKTGITDGAMAHLKGLAKLEYLNLYGTGIGDAGLAQLAGLKNLKRVYLWQTKVTDAGVAELKKAAPGVVVNRGEELAIVVSVPEPSGPKPVNTVCPVLDKPVNEKFTFTYEGKLVGFCCGKCCGQFAKDPKKFADKIKVEKPAVPATPAKPPTPEVKKPVAVNTVCPVSGKPVDAAVTFNYEGKTVGFCCKNCCGQFAKEPGKFAGNIK